MAADFPTSLHDFSATYADDTAQATTHPGIHNDVNEELAAVQTKVGVDSSAVATSLDYLVKNTSSSNPGHKHTLADGATDVTASAAELNLNDTAVAGTAVASKTAVLGANKELDEFHTAALYLGAGAGTQVTSTAAELNFNDTSVAGTAVASKTAVLGANKELDEFHTATLYLGAGAGTQVTSTAIELNITDGGSTAERVLNVNSKCRVYLSANQENITDVTWTKVTVDTENYDVGSDFDTTNKRFVAPVAGYYQVNGIVRWENLIANMRYAAGIYVNGSLYVHSLVHNGSNTGAMQVPVSDIVYCGAGQYIELYCFTNCGANTCDIGGGDIFETSMSIHLLSI